MGVLDGIKILSFNHFLSGPAAAQMLGDMGADVIAIEGTTGAFQRNWAVAGHFVGETSVNHIATGRNKRSLAINLKDPDALSVIRRLVETADVVMENFRPGTLAKMGLSWEAMQAMNPGLIYATATGFGVDGPYRDRPGQDILLQAMSGLAAHTGALDGAPVAVGSVPIDHHAASLYATGILGALVRKLRTGQGGRVDVNLLQAALDLQGESLTAWLNDAPRQGPRGDDGIASWFSGAPYGIHKAKDGYLVISMTSPGQLAKALDLPALADLPADAVFTHKGAITRQVSAAIATQTIAEWLPRLTAADVWHEEVRDYDSLRANPQIAHLGALMEAKGADGTPMTMIAHPIRYDGEAVPLRLPPQPLGAQSREILAEAGLSNPEIDALIARGAVAQTNKMRA
ncbi:CaiB/BaiF CoA transferase family protein [Falsigemmobacter faecalis]|uniref:CoA transferase n=1 Tax=Falsigemmobacter faecalis TaxID=2488730 RepID=A0A3P3D5C3_9RHOB|nr:CoA transferase [Falsigemmobacter faecalis]RRH69004.1 CoA transferase [Falsigemmobacter faecalis]